MKHNAHTSARLAYHAVDYRIAEMAGRQSSPYTGKFSARPAGKPGEFFIVEGEFATIPSTPPDSATAKNHTGRQYAFFKAWRNLSGPMESSKTNHPWGGTVPPPAGRPRSQVQARVGRTTPLLIVRR
jgi:hypothetical protein